jgi:hypothetical protein
MSALILDYLVTAVLFLHRLQDLGIAALAWIATNPDEAAGTLSGLLGAFLLARNGKGAAYGWIAFLASNFALIAFAWRHEHPGLLTLQLAFVATSSLGIWTWLLKPRLYWGEWRGNFDGKPTMWIMRLLALRGWRLDLHKMVAPDDGACHHTHPAKAVRLVLWRGYVEELFDDCKRVHWWPGRIGIVRPELCHRIASLPRGVSYSLWLRWPKTHRIELRGPGWSDSQRESV